MKKYIVLFPHASIIPASLLQRLKRYVYYELYPNVFFIQGEIQSPKALYDYLVDQNTDEKLVIFDVSTSGYWGYANKDFWSLIKGTGTASNE